MFKPALGAYPTMITPYNKDGSVDYEAVKALTAWYFKKGCAGIFASCQSSEIHELPIEDRVKLAAAVKETSDSLSKADSSRPKMTIVASGHISDSFNEQLHELRLIAETGVDSVILISNRFDIENSGDENWCYEIDRMIDVLPDIPLGVYECPRPYKRLLSEKMIDHITRTGRFAFIKDTCCDSEMIDRRIKQIKNTPSPALKPALFNANAQTMLDSLRSGAAGYCGIMCNFHPELYVVLCEIFDREPERAELIAALLSQSAFIENINYPSIAKYHLNKVGVKMNIMSRTSLDATAYDRMCVDRMDYLVERLTPYILDNINSSVL